MKLAELHEHDFSDLWSQLTPAQQAEIGAATLANCFALLVAGDDGSDTTPADRNKAGDLASQAFDGVESAVEAALPSIEWWTP